jgi:hypothetical protein
MLSLGVLYARDALQWALLERTTIGWAIADADVVNEPFAAAVKQARPRWKGTRPYVGLDWRLSEVTIANLGEGRPEIVSSVRIQRGDPKRLVTYIPEGKSRLIFDVNRDVVATTLTDWRKLGIEPMGLEPIEAAWLRTSAALDGHDAVLDVRSTPPVLLTMTDDMVFNELILSDTPEDDNPVIQAIRRARSEGSPMRSILVLGSVSKNILDQEGSASRFDPLVILGNQNPPWADAFALASAADAKETAKNVRAQQAAAKKAERIARAAAKKPKAIKA